MDASTAAFAILCREWPAGGLAPLLDGSSGAAGAEHLALGCPE